MESRSRKKNKENCSSRFCKHYIIIRHNEMRQLNGIRKNKDSRFYKSKTRLENILMFLTLAKFYFKSWKNYSWNLFLNAIFLLKYQQTSKRINRILIFNSNCSWKLKVFMSPTFPEFVCLNSYCRFLRTSLFINFFIGPLRVHKNRLLLRMNMNTLWTFCPFLKTFQVLRYLWDISLSYPWHEKLWVWIIYIHELKKRLIYDIGLITLKIIDRTVQRHMKPSN